MIVTDRPGEPPVLYFWLRERISLPWTEDMRCIGEMDDTGRIVAAAAFCYWRDDWCFASLAVDDQRFTRRFGVSVADYVFNTCQLRAAYAIIATDNHRIRRLMARFGFRLVAPMGNSELYMADAVSCHRWLPPALPGASDQHELPFEGLA